MAEAQFGIFNKVKPYLIGSLSGVTATCVIQPIDTVKVVIQNKGEAAGKSRGNISPFAVAKEIFKNNGIKGLYAGLDAAVLRQFIYTGIRLGLYKYFENEAKLQGRNLGFHEKIGYSLFSGAVGAIIANPTDVSLIRFQSDNNLPEDKRRNYKNIFDALRRIRAEQGIKGLWTGSAPTIGRAMAVNSSQLVSYNQLKELISKVSNQNDDTMLVRLTSSMISGVCVAIFSLPFDNVKTKIMRMKKDSNGILPYSGFFNCFIKSIRNQGFFGLWIGLPTFCVRMGPHAMITVLMQDILHDFWSHGKH